MTTQTETPADRRGPKGARISPFTLWFAVLGGSAAWAVQLLVAWSTLEITCLGPPAGARLQTGGTPGPTAMTVAYAATGVPWLVALLALLTCLRVRSKIRRTPADELATERVNLLVVIGLFLNVMALAAITGGGIALAVLEPCG
jgi:hypothetical protein